MHLNLALFVSCIIHVVLCLPNTPLGSRSSAITHSALGINTRNRIQVPVARDRHTHASARSRIISSSPVVNASPGGFFNAPEFNAVLGRALQPDSLKHAGTIGQVSPIANYKGPMSPFPYDNFVILGDSLSCTGNYVTLIAKKKLQPTTLYSNGIMYVDDTVWSEYFLKLVKDLTYLSGKTGRVKKHNEAYAWARVLNKEPKEGEQAVPSLSEQVLNHFKRPPSGNTLDLASCCLRGICDEAAAWACRNYFEAGPHLKNEKTLYFIWIGGNDYTSFKPKTEKIVDEMKRQIENILEKDPNGDVVVVTLPPGELLPVVPNAFRKRVKQTIDKHNEKLSEMIQSLDNPQISLIDVTSFLREMIENAQLYGFTNPVDPCLQEDGSVHTACDDLEHYVFLDRFHFTSKVHKLLAKFFFDQIISKP